MARFDFTEDAAHIHNWVRGMNPWPMAWFMQDGKRIKVQACRTADNPGGAAPGTVLALKPLTIAAGNGAVELLTVTPEAVSYTHLEEISSGLMFAGRSRRWRGRLFVSVR